MLKEQRSEVVSLLRIAARRLNEAGALEHVRMPAWDSVEDAENPVYRAARTIAADREWAGKETAVSFADLGELVHYLADMLED